MIKNYFKIAWRNLVKNKSFTLINVAGLSIGVAACLLIAMYIIHESSYDRQLTNAANTYRVVSSFNDEGELKWGIHFSANTSPTILKDFEEVENAGRILDNNLFYGAGANEIKVGDNPKLFHEEGFAYADPSILDIMDIDMVYGDHQSLNAPKSVIISKSIAEKYFGSSNPIGKPIFLNGNEDMRTISGVMEDFPSTSHMDYRFFLTLKGVEFGAGEQTRWIQSNYYTYVVLKPNTNLPAFNDKLGAIILGKYLKPALRDVGFAGWEDIEKNGKMMLQPITDINLHSGMISFESARRNDIKIMWIFGIIALFILAIATFNFINLNTAKSANRAKEVGMRKVVGSERKWLVFQFLTESVMLTALAFVLGLVITQLTLPLFEEMAGFDMSMPWTSVYFLPGLLGSILLVGFLAGIYPSLFLSGFNPIHVLKGKISMGSKSGGLRSSLVVIQFSISVALIIGTLIVNKQLDFILNSKFGFEKDQVVQLYGTNMMGDKIQSFKQEVEQLSDVESVSISDYLPIAGTKRNGNGIVLEGRDNLDPLVGVQAWVVDEDYINTLGIQLKEGRNFSPEVRDEAKTVIINEQAAKELNITDPLGKRISRYKDIYEIVGVVKDFNFDSMTDKVGPICLFYGISPGIVSVKMKSDDARSTIAQIEKKWNDFAPDQAIRYQFMDDTFAKMYNNLSRMRGIFLSFASLALMIACLGLFALSAFLVEQRKKEMSIRKVLGASFNQIFQVLTRNFIGLVFIAILIAAPIAWYMMDIWLQDYEYRININWQVFVVSGLAAIAVSLLTVSYHAFKAAVINPVNNLRGE
ncbi:MAG: ABC transporter permease [Saprospiraceae bacterium]|nr:ABC transporter permease [Saprospiraceae bacterium]